MLWVLVQKFLTQKYTRVITILKILNKGDYNKNSHRRCNLNLAYRELEEWLSSIFIF
jgi:hypothetical protein